MLRVNAVRFVDTCPGMCPPYDCILWDVRSPHPKEIGVPTGMDYTLGETPVKAPQLRLYIWNFIVSTQDPKLSKVSTHVQAGNDGPEQLSSDHLPLSCMPRSPVTSG